MQWNKWEEVLNQRNHQGLSHQRFLTIQRYSTVKRIIKHRQFSNGLPFCFAFYRPIIYEAVEASLRGFSY